MTENEREIEKMKIIQKVKSKPNSIQKVKFQKNLFFQKLNNQRMEKISKVKMGINDESSPFSGIFTRVGG